MLNNRLMKNDSLKMALLAGCLAFIPAADSLADEYKDATSVKGFMMGATNIQYGGFLKLDVNVTRHSDGSLPSNSLGRDFYIPGLVQVGGGDDSLELDFNPRETRFFFTTDTPLDGHTLKSKIEFDFQVTNVGDNERVSNSFSPRMRHAYIQFDNWLFGQTWTTFQDVSALPENLDFIGPAESTVFVRQPMIKWMNANWEIAIEQPEATITDSAGARQTPGDDFIPDVVVRYTHKDDWGHLRLAAIGRQLRADAGAIAGVVDDETEFGYAFSFSGKLKVGEKDDFRFTVNYGDGIGRYIAVNAVNDAIVDANGELEKVEIWSAFASYRHFWNSQWRSNFTVGYFSADHPADAGTAVTDSVYSIHNNLLYNPVPYVTLGVEHVYAERELENGMDGDMHRVIFSAKYAF